jgi:hypothetical protein
VPANQFGPLTFWANLFDKISFAGSLIRRSGIGFKAARQGGWQLQCADFADPVCAVHHEPWAERQACLREVGNLGEEHQIMEPNLLTGQTPFGVYTRAASQVEMSKTPQFWDNPMLYVQWSCKPEWKTTR